jgi:sugar phosphate isomerase/epimerase
MNNIFLSTAYFKNDNGYNVVKKLSKYKINNFELSAGKYFKNNIKKLKKINKKNNLVIHNYFPPPKKPFVLNLASTDKIIRSRSINHIKKNIINSKYFNNIVSFHAGFLLDPEPKKIGKVFDTDIKITNRKKGMDIFLKSVNYLSRYAKKRNVSLLIENNVLSASNYLKFKKNLLLMADKKETIYIMKNTPPNVNLLIDVAHLKVSAKTLNYSKFDYIKSCQEWVRAYHLSENDGKEDTNMKVKKNSWFWKYIKKDNLEYISMEINETNIVEIKKQLKLANQKIFNLHK